jgi:hypothetical protein
MIPGACLCGEVTYQIDSSQGVLTHCHCSSCRKHHGAPFASFLEVSPGGLRWLTGEDRLADGSSSARPRRFCRACGSVAPTKVGERYLVPAGNLSGELGEVTARHAFVDEKPAWHTIADALPQYSGAAPGWSLEQESASVRSIAGSITGSCLCGDVTFSVTGEPAHWFQCHCSRCRRARSAAHGSNTFYPLAGFHWRSGREQVRSYSPPDAKRFTASFCTRCGGGAPVERDNVPFVLVPAALFDADPGARPQAHIHIASKSTWYAVEDDLPQFAELPA